MRLPLRISSGARRRPRFRAGWWRSSPLGRGSWPWGRVCSCSWCSAGVAEAADPEDRGGRAASPSSFSRKQKKRGRVSHSPSRPLPAKTTHLHGGGGLISHARQRAEHGGRLRHGGPASSWLGRERDIRSHRSHLVLQLQWSNGSRVGASDGSDAGRSTFSQSYFWYASRVSPLLRVRERKSTCCRAGGSRLQ